MERYKSIALSNREIFQLLDGKCNVMTYPELTQFNTINDAMGKYKALVLLYLSKQNYGHWVCVFKRNENTIEFFDSYGFFPDDELNFIPQHFRVVSNQSYPHLTYLLSECPYSKIDYNDKRLQVLDDDTKTCGRWCVVRIMLKHMSIDEFIDKFKTDGDMMVTNLTSA
jgi:hypothetical protein